MTYEEYLLWLGNDDKTVVEPEPIIEKLLNDRERSIPFSSKWQRAVKSLNHRFPSDVDFLIDIHDSAVREEKESKEDFLAFLRELCESGRGEYERWLETHPGESPVRAKEAAPFLRLKRRYARQLLSTHNEGDHEEGTRLLRELLKLDGDPFEACPLLCLDMVFSGMKTASIEPLVREFPSLGGNLALALAMNKEGRMDTQTFISTFMEENPYVSFLLSTSLMIPENVVLENSPMPENGLGKALSVLVDFTALSNGTVSPFRLGKKEAARQFLVGDLTLEWEDVLVLLPGFYLLEGLERHLTRKDLIDLAEGKWKPDGYADECLHEAVRIISERRGAAFINNEIDFAKVIGALKEEEDGSLEISSGGLALVETTQHALCTIRG